RLEVRCGLSLWRVSRVLGVYKMEIFSRHVFGGTIMFGKLALIGILITQGICELYGYELCNIMWETGNKARSLFPVAQERVHVYYDKFDKRTTFTSKEILFNPSFELKAFKKDNSSTIMYTIWIKYSTYIRTPIYDPIIFKTDTTELKLYGGSNRDTDYYKGAVSEIVMCEIKPAEIEQIVKAKKVSLIVRGLRLEEEQELKKKDIDEIEYFYRFVQNRIKKQNKKTK
ncbi:MAG: hypothetical protein ACE5HI_12455, partial [bacterium]